MNCKEKPPPAERAGEERGAANAEEDQPFGRFLTLERERRNITLIEAAAAIRVPLSHLEALEDDAYDALPPKTYVRGFLAAYARYLNLDPEQMLHRFEEALLADARQRKEEDRAAIFGLFMPRGEGSHWRDWAIPIALVVAVVVFTGGSFFVGGSGKRDYSGTSLSPVRPPGPAPEALPSAPLAEKQGELDLVVPSSRKVGVRLVARAVGSTWISAQRDNLPVEEWTMQGGERRELTAEKRILLSIGNAGAVQFTYNERELGFIGHKGQVKRDLVFSAATD